MTEADRRIAPLAAEHTRALAECHIACWREAYVDLVPAHVLDAFDIDRRAEQWERNRVKYPGRTWVALAGAEVIGFAGAGETLDDPPEPAHQLYALYVRSPWYGTGLADELLHAALDPAAAYSLWVFERNPRALAFYRRHGFELDGTSRVEAFSPSIEVRMVRRPGPVRLDRVRGPRPSPRE
ncbi:acetyltransferase (GNAT) family protein [Nocardia tenerifensis]|uniref:Acetyltransferase (GNAT) family protein n=1 Tax=Nocardia tenerifensis TaxID=228006 RepID=A0A318K3Y7_9NOCA|nr:GNAT family N-acetyltransferase [Nocardia tenerifensis]PXX64126.1 acetyltransferase (GNAT) family protein [Nocardia tenerifensis]